MLAILLMLADAPQTNVVDAERAFAADAQKDGQWTAFRRWAAADATMFVPQPVKTQAFLKDRRDPPKAIDWWPTAAWLSCDGTLAVDTGGWKRADGSVGYFSTVWQRQPDGGWKWIVDGGDALSVARPQPGVVKVVRASCYGKGELDMGGNVISGTGNDDFDTAKDRTLNTGWKVEGDGSRSFFASIWTGHGWRQVIDDNIAAPPPNR